MLKKLNLNAIRIDGGTQVRESLNEEAVAEYAEAIAGGAELPPLITFHDGSEFWLVDGFHRLFAYRKLGKASALAEVHDGTLRDAKLFAAGANPGHGLRRTNETKRRAVLMLLEDSEWVGWSDTKIAKQCGVSQPFVGDVRRSILKPLLDTPPAVRTVERAGKTYKQDTTRIGKSAPPPTPPEVPREEIDFELAETQKAVGILSEENERLNDRLAVEAMDASEAEKSAAKDTIESLRAQVKTLTAELNAVKSGRDAYMREVGELKKQCASQRKQLDKLKAVA